MRKAISAMAVVLLVGAMAVPAMAGSGAATGLIGSVHDINNYSKTHAGVSADNENRLCVFCHTPHHASGDATLDYNPLWSHKTSTATYQPYQSATFSMSAYGGSDPLVGPSRLCMSCHDGQTAIDSHDGSDANTTATFVLTGHSVVGSATMAVDHPIGFDYTQAQQAKPTSLNPATTSWQGGSGTVAANLHNGTILTCATCHEVHNKVNAVNAPATDGKTYNWLVRSPQSGSQLCLTCHNT